MPTNTTLTTTVHSWLLQETLALLAYAKTDAVFAESLAAVIETLIWNDCLTIGDNTASKYLIPETQREAVATAHWLITTLQSQPSAKTARGTLQSFARQYVNPKNIVIGIVGVAIIGPTLGLIEQKKKKKPKAMLVFAEDFYNQLSLKDRVGYAIELTQTVIAKELRLAGGTITRLHPDTATWVMSEPLTRTSTATQAELQYLVETARDEQLSHIVRSNERGVVAVAISPRVNENFVDDFEVFDI